MRFNINRHCFLLIWGLLYTTVVCSEPIESGASNTIYFYNPETNINNFVSLKMSFDTFLSKFGNYRFQPFNNKDIFEQQVLKQKKGIYLLSSWHYQYLRTQLDMQPLMVGVSKGVSTQKKVLSVKNNLTKVEQLNGKTIASSGSEQYTKNLLITMLGDNVKTLLSTVKLVLVPKDIDALMAVGFGMADAALTSEKSLDNLQKLNPKQFKQLFVLKKSKNNYLSLAVSPIPLSQNADELLDILEKMGINPDGEVRLRMLGLDGWRRLSPQEQVLLKQGHNGL